MAADLSDASRLLGAVYADQIRKQLEQGFILGIRSPRKGHHEPVTAEVQAEFDAWYSEYERLRAIGEARGWVGYEGEAWSSPQGEWVWDEPEPPALEIPVTTDDNVPPGQFIFISKAR